MQHLRLNQNTKKNRTLGKGLEIWLGHFFYCLPNMENKFHFIPEKGYFRITHSSKNRHFLNLCRLYYIQSISFLQMNDCDRFETKNSCTMTGITKKMIPGAATDLSGRGQCLKSLIAGEEHSKDSSWFEIPWAWKALGVGKGWKLFCFT